MSTYIYILPKDVCLDIARKNNPHKYQESVLLEYLPDTLYGSTVESLGILDGMYVTVDGWQVPMEFTQESLQVDTICSNSNPVAYSNENSFISHEIVIGRDPWVLRIDVESAMVKVNPIVMHKQTDDIVKDVLCALNGAMLEEWRRFYGKQQDVSEM